MTAKLKGIAAEMVRRADERVRAAENQLSSAHASAAVAAQAVNPDHPRFQDMVLDRMKAAARVEALSARLEQVRLGVDAASRDAEVAGAKEAELERIDAEIGAHDVALLKLLLEAHAAARGHLAQIDALIARADELETELAVHLGETVPSHRHPNLTRSYFAGLIHSSNDRILHFLEPAALEAETAWRRDKKSLLRSVLESLPKTVLDLLPRRLLIALTELQKKAA